MFLVSRRGSNILLVNDLDTLPANFLVSKLRPWPLIFDSHEYFTERAELNNRIFVRNFWLRLEKFLVPRVKLAYTVNETLAKMYAAKYGISFGVVRNLPDENIAEVPYSLPEHFKNQKIILYQGALNKDRGLEQIIKLMPGLDIASLVIA